MSSLHLHLRIFHQEQESGKGKTQTLATSLNKGNLKLVKINEPKMASRNVQTF